jgi:3-deoxy-D-manno-octulosonic-acid transferase
MQVECSFPMYLVYSALLALALIVSLPYWLLQIARHGKYREGLLERLGQVPDRFKDGGQRAIWVHAVSVGEVLAVSQLIQRIQKRFPQYRLVISTTTTTGQKLARERFGSDCTFYFPIDFAFSVRRYLLALRPQLVVIAETELWPNFLRLSKQAGARLAVVNARISDRSWSGYRWIRPWLKPALACVDCFLAQTEEDRGRLVDIGVSADRVQVSGNLKFDVSLPPEPEIVASLRSAFERSGTGPVIVAGSTMEGEEPLLLRAFEIIRGSRPKATMILAPRHPQRFQQVADLVSSLGIPCWRRSLWSGEDLSGTVLLLDTMGELAAVYAIAHVAFVGGSLSEHGGHNILEPAQHGVPVIVGPHYENFREIVNSFRAADSVRVVGPAELPLVLVELLANEAERQALGRRGLEAVRRQSGATEKTLAALENLLSAAGSDCDRPLEAATRPRT